MRDSNKALPQRLKDHLRAKGLVLDTVLAKSGSLWAFGARLGSQANRRLVAVDLSDAAVKSMGTVALPSLEPYPSAEWFSYGDGSNDGLLYRFDSSSEGVARTEVFRIENGQLRVTFRDSKGACKPAELIRYGKTAYLQRYTEYPDADCEMECSILLREDAGIEPAWVSLLQWNGGEWKPLEKPSPDIYRPIAARYKRGLEFMSTNGAKSCASQGAAVRRAMERWLARADRLAR